MLPERRSPRAGSTAAPWWCGSRCGWESSAAASASCAPDGSELTPPTKPQPDGVLVKALARAWRWQKLLNRGVYGSVPEIAET